MAAFEALTDSTQQQSNEDVWAAARKLFVPTQALLKCVETGVPSEIGECSINSSNSTSTASWDAGEVAASGAGADFSSLAKTPMAQA